MLTIDTQITPNPNAYKFILNQMVKAEGKATYRTPMECLHVPLACALFTIRGVDQIHFFQNTITITKFGYEDWEILEVKVRDCLIANMGEHQSDYSDPNPEEERRQALTPQLQEIEAIIDRTIRPSLQADGGDLQCLSYENNVLLISYQGACGACPSSSAGTLHAIRSILQEELNPEIEVYIAPD